MDISNCVKNKDGSLDFDFHVDPEEAGFLLSLAIKMLIHEGVLSLSEDTNQQIDLFPETEGGLQ
jgi:hypothetical protein